jgi:hypothetical protein
MKFLNPPFKAVAKRGSCKTVFLVILNEAKNLKLLEIQDSSLRSA